MPSSSSTELPVPTTKPTVVAGSNQGSVTGSALTGATTSSSGSSNSTNGAVTGICGINSYGTILMEYR